MAVSEIQHAIAELARTDVSISRDLFAKSNMLSRLTADPQDFALKTLQETLRRLEIIKEEDADELNKFVHDEFFLFHDPEMPAELSFPAGAFANTSLGKAISILDEEVSDRYGPMYDPIMEITTKFSRFVLGSAIAEINAEARGHQGIIEQ
jgi:hypothetical protein